MAGYLISWDNPSQRRNARLLNEVERFFQGEQLYCLDLGCSGGQFVVDLDARGHKAIGIEGRDSSIRHKSANWSQFHDTLLFTADIAKPFEVLEENETVKFDSVTAWEVLE